MEMRSSAPTADECGEHGEVESQMTEPRDHPYSTLVFSSIMTLGSFDDRTAGPASKQQKSVQLVCIVEKSAKPAGPMVDLIAFADNEI